MRLRPNKPSRGGVYPRQLCVYSIDKSSGAPKRGVDSAREILPQDSKLGSRFAFCSLFVLVGQVGLLLALDVSSRLLFDRLGFIESCTIVSILALLLLLHLSNSLVLDGFVALRSILEGSFPGWLLKVRFLLAGLPLLGIYMLPAWEWVLASCPRWSRCRAVEARKRSTPLSGRLLLLFCKSRTRWLRLSVYNLLGLLVLNLLILGTAVIRLGSSRAGLLDLASVQFFLQVSAFGTAMTYVGSRSGTRELSLGRGWLCFLPAFLFLCPFSDLGLVVIFLGEKKRAGRKSVVMEAAYANWQGIGTSTRERGRNLKWWQISQSWRFEWFSARSPGRPAIVGRKLLAFYRFKTFLLAIDATALSRGLVWTARRIPALTPALELALALLTTFSAGLVLLGLPVFAADMLWRVAWGTAARTLERPPTARYLLLTQLAFFVGLHLGIILAQENYGYFRRMLMWIGLVGVGISITGDFLFLRQGRNAQKSIRSSFSRAASFIVVIITGGMLEGEGQPPARRCS